LKMGFYYAGFEQWSEFFIKKMLEAFLGCSGK